MKKKSIFVLTLFALSALLFAEGSKNKDFYFDKDSYDTLTYKNIKYYILATQVDRRNIRKLEYKVNLLLIIDGNGALIKVIRNKLNEIIKLKKNLNGNYTSIAVNNLYRMKNNSLCIGLNDSYFQLVKSVALKKSDALLVLKPKASNKDSYNDDKDFYISKDDCSIIVHKNNRYKILDRIISDSKVDDYLFVMAEHRLFDKTTGRELGKKERSRIDFNGKKTKNQKRLSWIYEEVYSLKNISIQKAFAIRINNKWRLAENIDIKK